LFLTWTRYGPAVFIGGIILTGGTGRRLGGADKAALTLDGLPLLEHALAAMAEVPDVVVVGDPTTTSRPVTFTRETPSGGGPALGVLAGLRAFETLPTLVAVLAVDMPRVTTATFRRLMLDAGRDGALLVDRQGKKQHLCGVYSGAALLAAAPDAIHRGSMKALLKPLKLTKVAAVGKEARDVDTWEDLKRLSS